MPTKVLPERADIDHLKHQAKDLLRAQRSGRPDACQRIREFHPVLRGADDARLSNATFTLSDAQATLAREYGYASWRRLRDVVAGGGPDTGLPHHERIEDAVFRQAVDMIDDGDAEGLRRHLARHPDLAQRRVRFEGGNYFQNPALLAFIAENPIRNARLPDNIVAVAETVMAAGASPEAISETLGLVCSGRVVRETGVQGPLIQALCRGGADPDAAMLPALGHGEFAAVEALIDAGATVDLSVAAATNRAAASALIGAADAETRHRALALAAQHGHAGMVRLMLEHGEDPNRYNPVGCHAHSTPLHQAALAGWLDVVRVLVEGGAKTDLRDIHHNATPEGWARHAGHADIAALLSSNKSLT